MLKVLMLDLSETLAAGELREPFALEALAALSRFETAEGEPLQLCVLSDSPGPDDSAAPASVRHLTAEFADRVDDLGIGRFFRPTSQRVTLAAHAGASTRPGAIYVTALARLGVDADLDESVVVTDDDARAKACRRLGMKALVLGTDVTDWPETVLALRHLVAPHSAVDIKAALALAFGAQFGAEVIELDGPFDQRRAIARVRLPNRRRLSDVRIGFADDGAIESIEWPEPDAAEADEAAAFTASLREHGQLATGENPLDAGATHRYEESSGRIIRERYSAF